MILKKYLLLIFINFTFLIFSSIYKIFNFFFKKKDQLITLLTNYKNKFKTD